LANVEGGSHKRELSKVLTDDELVAGFEAGSLADFHHADHVRLTLVYLARHGRDVALRRMTDGVRRLAAIDGHPEKFHLTMTRAWVDLLQAARVAHPEAPDPAALVEACPALLDKDALLRFYSRESLDSERARTGWVSPDRASPIVCDHARVQLGGGPLGGGPLGGGPLGGGPALEE
jgi:hypothetical protein